MNDLNVLDNQPEGQGETPVAAKCCAKPALSDMSYKKWKSLKSRELARVDHAICLSCWSHRWQGQWFDRSAWEAWINGVITKAQFLRRRMAVAA